MASQKTIEQAPIKHLRKVYPQLAHIFDAIGIVTLPSPSSASVADAVTRHIVGQMLSSAAAATIYNRLILKSETCKCLPWQLENSQLLECGLSRGKSRAIREFGLRYDSEPEKIEAWRYIPYSSLKQEMRSYWGISDWTAAMLAIFHFGHSDIFPVNDGSISRAITMIEDRFYNRKDYFDPTLASPYGTYLALTLWASLDRGYWKQQ